MPKSSKDAKGIALTNNNVDDLYQRYLDSAQDGSASDKKAYLEDTRAQQEENRKQRNKVGGGSGGVGVTDTREMQLGTDLDPKSMMRRGYNDGGLVRATGSMAPNECTYNGGPGVRSQQDYKK